MSNLPKAEWFVLVDRSRKSQNLTAGKTNFDRVGIVQHFEMFKLQLYFTTWHILLTASISCCDNVALVVLLWGVIVQVKLLYSYMSYCYSITKLFQPMEQEEENKNNIPETLNISGSYPSTSTVPGITTIFIIPVSANRTTRKTQQNCPYTFASLGPQRFYSFSSYQTFPNFLPFLRDKLSNLSKDNLKLQSLLMMNWKKPVALYSI